MTDRRRLDHRRPTDVPTARIPRLTLADLAAEYEAAFARARAQEPASLPLDELARNAAAILSAEMQAEQAEMRAALGVGGGS